MVWGTKTQHEFPVALQPSHSRWAASVKKNDGNILGVMEKAACFTVIAGMEGELKKSDSVQSIALFC